MWRLLPISRRSLAYRVSGLHCDSNSRKAGLRNAGRCPTFIGHPDGSARPAPCAPHSRSLFITSALFPGVTVQVPVVGAARRSHSTLVGWSRTCWAKALTGMMSAVKRRPTTGRGRRFMLSSSVRRTKCQTCCRSDDGFAPLAPCCCRPTGPGSRPTSSAVSCTRASFMRRRRISRRTCAGCAVRCRRSTRRPMPASAGCRAPAGPQAPGSLRAIATGP
jgi:hypothetical protein